MNNLEKVQAMAARKRSIATSPLSAVTMQKIRKIVQEKGLSVAETRVFVKEVLRQQAFMTSLINRREPKPLLTYSRK
jgi:hypothetical protein